MRVVINDDLVKEVVSTTGLSIENAVEEGLRLLIKVNRQQGIRRLKGKIAWQGNLHEMREGRIKNES
jgi:hypothetical protein